MQRINQIGEAKFNFTPVNLAGRVELCAIAVSVYSSVADENEESCGFHHYYWFFNYYEIPSNGCNDDERITAKYNCSTHEESHRVSPKFCMKFATLQSVRYHLRFDWYRKQQSFCMTRKHWEYLDNSVKGEFENDENSIDNSPSLSSVSSYLFAKVAQGVRRSKLFDH